MGAAEDYEAGKAAYADWRFADAEAALTAALAAKPDYYEAKVYLARTLEAQDRMDVAIALYREALTVQPDHGVTHLLLAQALLASGQYADGWAEYEWRYSGEGGKPFPHIDKPRWQGEPLDGRTLLVIGDQGYGDSIQFARFLPRLKELGAKVTLGASQPMAALMARAAGVDHLFHDWHYVGPFDCFVPISSLANVLKVTDADLPGPMPYLEADARRVARWSRRILPAKGRRRIGVCWAGRPTHPNDRHRSIPFEKLARHLSADAEFFSLQKGERAADAAGSRVADLSARLHDFAETAAVMANLDLVVSVDTSIVHLAGAMGRPVHLLLPYVADWRWGRPGVNATPWYPSVKLCRQDAPGDWSGPLAAAFA